MDDAERTSPAWPDALASGELDGDLRDLALRLVGDPASADDVVQEAWLAALGERTGRVRDWRGWLRAVARNVARKDYHRARRREEIEAFVARAEAEDESGNTVDDQSTRALLEAAVGALREPYRGVLRLRYFDELSAQAIGERLGRSRATVRSQLRRGLAELRLALDRRFDGRRAAWLPLVARHAVGPREAHTAIAASAGGVVALVLIPALLVAAAALVVWFVAHGANERPGERLATSEGTGHVAALASDEVAEDATRVEVAGESGEGPEEVAAPIEPTRKLAVTVLREDGSPLAAATVRVWGRTGRATQQTDALGRAEIAVPVSELMGEPRFTGPHGGVFVRGGGTGEAWSLQHELSLPPEGRSIEVRSRGRAQSIRGTVVDERGVAISSASVLLLGERQGSAVVDGAPVADGDALYHADEGGVFELHGLPRRVHRVLVRAAGHVALQRTLDGSEDVLEPRIVLASGGAVSGLVRDVAGQPAVGARVWRPDAKRKLQGAGEHEVFTDAEGRFELGGLAAKTHIVFARAADDPHAFAAIYIDIEHGTSVPWSPTLARTDGVRVRLEDHAGEPLAVAPVVLYTPATHPVWVEAADTDEEGRATFLHVPPDVQLGVIARRTRGPESPTSQHPIERATDEVVVRLPRERGMSTLVGTLLDAESRPVPDAALVGWSGIETLYTTAAPDTGAFTIPAIVPGTYELAVLFPGYGAVALGSHELLAGAQLDLGVLRAPTPVAVAVEWGDSIPTPAQPWFVYCRLAGPSEEPRILLVKAPRKTLLLLPGSYRLGPEFALNGGTAFEVLGGGNDRVRIGE